MDFAQYKIETMSIQETCDAMRELGIGMTNATVYRGIEQGVFPFGDCITGNKQKVYRVYRKLFEKWVEERAIHEYA